MAQTKYYAVLKQWMMFPDDNRMGKNDNLVQRVDLGSSSEVSIFTPGLWTPSFLSLLAIEHTKSGQAADVISVLETKQNHKSVGC